MKFTELEIPGLIYIEPDVWKDDRGFFEELYHARKYIEGGITKPFVQDNHSHSLQNVLRGLHYQRRHPQGKLVYTLSGAIFDVAVDLRRGSPAFGKWVGKVLSAENHAQLYVPEGCAHGFCVLGERADVMYKCTELYSPADDTGIRWNDPALAIQWPVSQPALSPKDAVLPVLSDLAEEVLPCFE